MPVNVRKEDKFLHLLNILMEYKRYFISIVYLWLAVSWLSNSRQLCLFLPGDSWKSGHIIREDRKKTKKISKLGSYRSLLSSAGSKMCHLVSVTVSNHINFTAVLKSPSQTASLLYCPLKTSPDFEVTCWFPIGVIIQMKSHHGDTSTIKS